MILYSADAAAAAVYRHHTTIYQPIQTYTKAMYSLYSIFYICNVKLARRWLSHCISESTQFSELLVLIALRRVATTYTWWSV